MHVQYEIDAFILYLSSERRVSPHTIVAYKTDLNQFATYLSQNFPTITLGEVTVKILRTWIMVLAEQLLDNKSINRKIVSLRTFYKFLQKKTANIINPTARVTLLKSHTILPISLQENELLAFLDQYEFQDTFNGWRDKLVLELLYGTGIRLAELLHLSIKDLNMYECTIKVMGKGYKERIIPFPKSLQVMIRSYVNQRNLLVSNSPLLFLTQKGSPCYPMMVYRIVKKYLRSSGARS